MSKVLTKEIVTTNEDWLNIRDNYFLHKYTGEFVSIATNKPKTVKVTTVMNRAAIVEMIKKIEELSTLKFYTEDKNNIPAIFTVVNRLIQFGVTKEQFKLIKVNSQNIDILKDISPKKLKALLELLDKEPDYGGVSLNYADNVLEYGLDFKFSYKIDCKELAEYVMYLYHVEKYNLPLDTWDRVYNEAVGLGLEVKRYPKNYLTYKNMLDFRIREQKDLNEKKIADIFAETDFYKEMEIDGVTVTPLNSITVLEENANYMRNCTRGYWQRIYRKELLVFSVVLASGERFNATAWRGQDGYIKNSMLSSILGRFNAASTAEQKEEISKIVKKYIDFYLEV
jgi:hypothetical protein